MYEDLSNDFSANTSTPGTIAIGSWDWGQITPSGDSDWFRVSLTAGTQYQFTIEAGATNGLFDPQLGVYSSAGVLLIQATVGQGFQSKHVEYTPTANSNHFLAASGDPSLTGTYKITASAVGGTGSAANDTFTGTSGNDTVDGGAGVDTVVYTGNCASYTITRTSTGFTVSGGADGSDMLTNIDRLHFADGKLGFDTSGTSGEMYRLYKAAFNRVPDAPGLGWNINLVDNGLTLAQMSAAFVASAEFTNTYGALSNTQFLDRLYLNVLGRPADAVGAAHNLNLLDTNAVNRPGMLAAYSESAENQLAVIGQIQDGIWFI